MDSFCSFNLRCFRPGKYFFLISYDLKKNETFSLLSPPAIISFSSSLPGTNGLIAAASVFVAFLEAIKKRARVILRQRPCKNCSSQTTTSIDVRPTQLTCPDKRISESYCRSMNFNNNSVVFEILDFKLNVPLE